MKTVFFYPEELSSHFLIKDLSEINSDFIEENCKRIFKNRLLCLKRQVFAVLTIKHKDGFLCFFGTNYRRYDVGTGECPRIRHQYHVKDYKTCYTECISICKQEFHAETCALALCKRNDFSGKGGHIYITGHEKCCPNCEQSAKETGIIYAKSFKPDKDGSLYEKLF